MRKIIVVGIMDTPRTPRELYALPPSDVDMWHRTLDVIDQYLPELADLRGRLPGTLDPSGRLEVRVHRHVELDERRIWRLASLWMDGFPFVITQNAGRNGHDWRRRYITDIRGYRVAVRHLQVLAGFPTGSIGKVDEIDLSFNMLDLDEELSSTDSTLTSFYGGHLDDC